MLHREARRSRFVEQETIGFVFFRSMDIQAHLGNLRISPRKVRAVAALLPGLPVREASVQLERELRRTALPLRKLLLSALSSAEHNFQSLPENLIVARVLVNEGKKLKRWMPRAQGRATPIWKRLSEVHLVLRELDPSLKGNQKRTIRSKKKDSSEIRKSESSLSSGTPRSDVGKRGSGVRASRSIFHRKSV